MIISKKGLLQCYFLFLFIILFLFLCFKDLNFWGKNIFVIVTFITNSIMIMWNIFSDKRPFSLNKTFWYFSFFFFFLSPLFQYLTSYCLWDYYIADSVYLQTNINLSLCFITYIISSFLLKNKKVEKFEMSKICFQKNKLRVLFFLSIISFLILLKNISFEGLLVRKSNNLSFDSGAIKLILENCLRAIPVYSMIYSILYVRKKKCGYIYLVLLSFITVLINFPASITRYWIGIVYIGVGIVCFKKYIINKRFDYLMILLFAFFFPIFQLFKWYTFSEIFDLATIGSKLSSVYNNVDFDAYSMFSRVIIYVSDNGPTFGNQLLSTLFFFVPRSLWNNKPVPTGQFIAESQNQFFTNLSCPFFAEGFVDFSIIGSIVYIIVLSRIIIFMDNTYWSDDNDYSFINFVYPFCFGVLIFLLRGSMQPVIVYTFTYFLFLIFLKKFLVIKRRK